MVTSNPKNWKVYCKATFKSLCAILEDWDTNDEDVVRITTRIYYEGVFSCGLGDTGLISKNALNDPSNRTDDHCFSPQFVGRYIMDNPHIYLTDYNKFDEIFVKSCTKIKVTKKENKQLSQFTINKRGQPYQVLVPTDKKYERLGIELYKRPDGKTRWNTSQPTQNKVNYLQELLEYEKNFIV